jgi:glycosyltransferase involved in cell wall biosynthesis
MKRALIISWFFPPLRGIASLRAGKWAKYLPDAGYWPIVVTAEKSAYGESDLPVELSRGEVHEVPYFDPLIKARLRVLPPATAAAGGMGRSPGRRLLDAAFRLGTGLVGPFEARGCLTVPARMPGFYEFWALSCSGVVEEILRRHRGEVRAMVSSSGPPACHLLGLQVKRRHPEIRWVADFRDLWTQNPNYRGIFPFTRLECALERAVLSRADAVVTVSEGLAEALRDRCPAEVHVIENGFDEDELCPIPAAPTRPGEFTLAYTGTVYVSRQDPVPLFEALEGLLPKSAGKAPPGILVRFLVTNRQGREYLEELVESYGLRDAVRVEAALPHRDAIAVQKGADALLLLERDPQTPNDRGVLTGKVFEYLAARKPILGIGFGPGGELGRLLVSSGLGSPLGRDANRIRQALEAMIRAKDTGTADRLVKPDEAVIGRYSRRKQAARLAELLDSPPGRRAPNPTGFSSP